MSAPNAGATGIFILMNGAFTIGKEKSSYLP
jgi:hypothetical protein